MTVTTLRCRKCQDAIVDLSMAMLTWWVSPIPGWKRVELSGAIHKRCETASIKHRRDGLVVHRCDVEAESVTEAEVKRIRNTYASFGWDVEAERMFFEDASRIIAIRALRGES